MPVREISPGRSSEHLVLVNELAAEWKHPDASQGEPDIFIERAKPSRPGKVYVIWSKWADVDRIERSEIIMEAAELALPRSQVLDIAIAMGLTRDEAARMGLVFP
jgi:hypothetical protein